jgi:hypothetical protein
MISDFALLLSQEGITLAHRTAGGWVSLGHVPLMDKQFSDRLAELQSKGHEIAGDGFLTHIVLPDDQIKYFSLPHSDDDSRDAAIKEALERETPYLQDELAFDWEDGDDGLKVAAVARDTLREAEDFAVQHGFNPVCFVAAPDDAQFSVEPFFGMSDWSTINLPDQTEPEAELVKVRLDSTLHATPVALNDDEFEEDPEPEEPQGEIESPLQALRPSLGPATRSAPAEDASKPLRAQRFDKAKEPDADLENRDFPSWAGSVSATRDTSAETEVDPASVDWLPNAHDSDDEIEQDQPPSWMGEASIHSNDEDETSAAASWIPKGKPSFHPAAYDQLSDEAEQMEVFGNRSAQREDERRISPVLFASAAVVALAVLLGGFFGYRALTGEPDVDVIASGALVTESTPADTPVAQEEQTQDEEQPQDTATETLDVAADTEKATDAQPETESVDTTSQETLSDTAPNVFDTVDADPVSPDDGAAPEVTGSDLTSFAGSEAAQALLETPAEETLGQITDGQPPAPLATTEDSDTLAAMAPLRPSDEATTEGEPVALQEVATALGQEQADLLIGAAQDWDTLSEDAKLARYAATGIWPVAPDALSGLSGSGIGDIFLTTLDPKVFETDAYAIPTVSELLTDKALTAMPNPPAPGTRFDRDYRGLIVATSEGAVTPDGITVYAAVPPLIPPLAPRPDPAQQQNEQRAALAGKIPQLRPQIAEETEETTTEATAAVGVKRMPPLRPAAVEALAAQIEAVQSNPLAVPEAPTPKLRPSNMSAIVYATERAEIAAQTTTRVAPSATSAANAATESNVLPLREISLIGVYGSQGDRRALVRLASGRYVKIEVGDRLERGQVTAIDTDKVYYSRNGQSYVLEMPTN